MPLKRCMKDGKPGYKWGEGNQSCFTYTVGNEESRKRARKKAMEQAAAIESSKQASKKK